jgi:hypothetical protein
MAAADNNARSIVDGFMANGLLVKNEVTTFVPRWQQKLTFQQQIFDHSKIYCALYC